MAGGPPRVKPGRSGGIGGRGPEVFKRLNDRLDTMGAGFWQETTAVIFNES
jgi:hypothetical protein